MFESPKFEKLPDLFPAAGNEAASLAASTVMPSIPNAPLLRFTRADAAFSRSDAPGRSGATALALGDIAVREDVGGRRRVPLWTAVVGGSASRRSETKEGVAWKRWPGSPPIPPPGRRSRP